MSNLTTARRLLAYLNHYAHMYASSTPIWQRFIQQHQARPRPAWNFISMTEVSDIQLAVLRDVGMPESEITPQFLSGLVRDLSALTALGTWQVTRGVYRIDHSLLTALWDTPVTGDLPGEALKRMPEWCVYVETPVGATHLSRTLLGFWAWLDPDPRGLELRLLPDLQPQPGQPLPAWLPLGIPLGGTLEQGIATYFGQPHATPELHGWAQGAISCMLYLCSEAAEYSGPAPRQPTRQDVRRAQYHRKNPDQVYVIGKRLGETLRRDHRAASSSSAGGEKSAHLRRPHWTTVWIGKRGQQQPAPRWIPPLLIRADKLADEDRPVVIRKA